MIVYTTQIYTSCREFHLNDPSAPSGSYQRELSNGTIVDMYCDMEGTNCGGEGGWTRVAFVNMSQPGVTCPTGLTQIQRSGLTLCSRGSTMFTTLGLNYTAICGRVRGYQSGQPDGFRNSISNSALTVDNGYVDGVSITHGSCPRQHVWTYAIGLEDDGSGSSDCPCNNGNSGSTSSFVGDKYYCESGIDNHPFEQGVLYSNDPLWDGMNCNNRESTCCTNSNLPWFDTTLSDTTNDDLELRLLFNEDISGEDGPLDLIELYINF